MKVEQLTDIFGEPIGMHTVVLNAGERAVLRKASSVLADLRKRGATASTDWEATDQATDVALAGHLCRELADEGEVEL